MRVDLEGSRLEKRAEPLVSRFQFGDPPIENGPKPVRIGFQNVQGAPNID